LLWTTKFSFWFPSFYVVATCSMFTQSLHDPKKEEI